jgi:hypothetical protein
MFAVDMRVGVDSLATRGNTSLRYQWLNCERAALVQAFQRLALAGIWLVGWSVPRETPGFRIPGAGEPLADAEPPDTTRGGGGGSMTGERDDHLHTL